jgi:hypothetical protein
VTSTERRYITPADRPHRAPRGKHGLTRQELDMLVGAQGGRCLICGDPVDGPGQAYVDHDHELAKAHGHDPAVGCRLCVRGILDDKCNRGLGAFRDDPDALERAALYLRRSRRAQ